jgi:hypothetical protein
MHPQAAASSTGSMFRTSSPDFSSLSPEELEQLELVLQKQALIENEQTQRLAGLRRTMIHLQQTIENDQQRTRALSSIISHNTSSIQQNQSILTSSDIVQCYICFSIIEIQANNSPPPPPILCADCHRPVCRRCGNYTSPEFIQPPYRINLENQSHASKWRCRLCIVRREVVRKSGTCLNIDSKSINE